MDSQVVIGNDVNQHLAKGADEFTNEFVLSKECASLQMSFFRGNKGSRLLL